MHENKANAEMRSAFTQAFPTINHLKRTLESFKRREDNALDFKDVIKIIRALEISVEELMKAVS